MLSIEQKLEIEELRKQGQVVAARDSSNPVAPFCMAADVDKWEKCDDWAIQLNKGIGLFYFDSQEVFQTWLIQISEEIPDVLNKLVVGDDGGDGYAALFKKEGLKYYGEFLAGSEFKTDECGKDYGGNVLIEQIGSVPQFWGIPIGEEQREPFSWVKYDVDVEGEANLTPIHQLEEVSDEEYGMMREIAQSQNRWKNIERANRWLRYSNNLWVSPMGHDEGKEFFLKGWSSVKLEREEIVTNGYYLYNIGLILNDDLIAFDVDNDGPIVFPAFIEKIKTEAPELCGKIYSERSQSGGGHIIVKHHTPCRSRYTVAERYGVEGQRDKHGKAEDPQQKITIIEVLGKSNGVCVAPSRGYETLEGFCQLDELPYLSDEEWGYLDSVARSFSHWQVAPPKPREPKDSDYKPLDVPEGVTICDPYLYFNRCGFAEFSTMLRNNGWTILDGRYHIDESRPDSTSVQCRRPGKYRGTSGDLKKVNGVWFFCNFSGSVPELEVEKPKPYCFTRCALEFGGDWKECYNTLAKEMWEKQGLKNLSSIKYYLNK